MFSVEPVWQLLSQRLDACALRQAVYSANIANADVPGYEPLEVNFESQLQSMNNLFATSEAGQADLLQSLQPTVVASTQETVELDQQLAMMSKNALQYQALLGAFQHSVGLLRLAVLEGKEG
jgi:flagellar basal-body rod protein FlgB